MGLGRRPAAGRGARGLHAGPVRYDGNWLRWVNRPQTAGEEEALRKCIVRGTPYGSPVWQRLTARRLGLESSLRPRPSPAETGKVARAAGGASYTRH